jgi:phosphotriesterase-related protein
MFGEGDDDHGCRCGQIREHLIKDSVLVDIPQFEPASERHAWDQPITLENAYDVRRNWNFYKTNLQLTSVEDAAEAARIYASHGGGCIVDVTSGGLCRDPRALARVSRMSGVHVVMGGSWYVHEYHPAWLADASEEELAEIIIREFREGTEVDRAIKPGIIGEVGLTWPVHPDERKVLRASARAQVETGLALSIHPGRHPDAPIEAVRIVEEAGGDVSRTVICHLDRTIDDIEKLIELAGTGCYLEFDLFGLESAYYPWSDIDMPNDAIRVNFMVGLAEAGFLRRLLASHDVDMKARLRRYGGEGYEHLLAHVVPIMHKKGFDDDDVHTLLTKNPAEMLAIAA